VLFVTAVATLLGACASTTPAPAPATGRVELTVRVVGLASDDGVVAVALYDRPEAFNVRELAVASAWLEPVHGVAVWPVGSLDPGLYAVAAYHDLDGDRELDRPTLGPPTEPYGFSRDARGTFGPPSFDAAAVELAGGMRTVEVTVR
jgi:uncharacterized protein (DUF2141 family)